MSKSDSLSNSIFAFFLYPYVFCSYLLAFVTDSKEEEKFLAWKKGANQTFASTFHFIIFGKKREVEIFLMALGINFSVDLMKLSVSRILNSITTKLGIKQTGVPTLVKFQKELVTLIIHFFWRPLFCMITSTISTILEKWGPKPKEANCQPIFHHMVKVLLCFSFARPFLSSPAEKKP